jgi:ribosomal protein L22
VFFIDDLLRVRKRVNEDTLRSGLGLKLKDLAESRESSLKIVKDYVLQAKAKSPKIVFMIFAKQHPTSTFVDLVLGKKPRIYLSYHITGQEDFKDVQRLMNKLQLSFVCIDPYAIKDWQIVGAYDQAIRKNKKEVIMKTMEANGTGTIDRLSLKETKETIDLIRSQIVERDLEIIANVHATVVYHRSDKPSYGVMVEVFHSATMVQRPVYVLYPFKVRLSPFFEHYVRPGYMIQGEKDVRRMENALVNKLKKEYKKWSTWSPPR